MLTCSAIASAVFCLDLLEQLAACWLHARRLPRGDKRAEGRPQMAVIDYAFCRGLEYPSIVAVSQRVAWTVDEIFADRRFDATKHIVPDSWLGTGHLAFLSDRDQRTLNHADDIFRAVTLAGAESGILDARFRRRVAQPLVLYF